MSDAYVDNNIYCKTNLVMFSTESTCNPHKNKLSGKRYSNNTKVSATIQSSIVHTSWNQKITFYFESVILIVMESVSIQRLVDDIEGC